MVELNLREQHTALDPDRFDELQEWTNVEELEPVLGVEYVRRFVVHLTAASSKSPIAPFGGVAVEGFGESTFGSDIARLNENEMIDAIADLWRKLKEIESALGRALDVSASF